MEVVCTRDFVSSLKLDSEVESVEDIAGLALALGPVVFGSLFCVFGGSKLEKSEV